VKQKVFVVVQKEMIGDTPSYSNVAVKLTLQAAEAVSATVPNSVIQRVLADKSPDIQEIVFLTPSS
jgi:hypothetical protein